MNSKPDGRYQGTIVSAYVADDQFEAGQYVLNLDVNIEGGGAVTCRQSLADSDRDKKAKRDSVLRELGLPWPFKAADMHALDGNPVGVNLKTSPKGRQNAYVATARPEKVLTDAEIDAALSGAGNDLPF